MDSGGIGIARPKGALYGVVPRSLVRGCLMVVDRSPGSRPISSVLAEKEALPPAGPEVLCHD